MDSLIGVIAFLVGGLVLLAALYGALKPLFWRLTGRTQALKRQDEQNALLKEQNRLMSEMIKKQNPEQ